MTQTNQTALTITGYTLTVKRGARAGQVKTYGPNARPAARRLADRIDNEYGAIACSVCPIFADAA